MKQKGKKFASNTTGLNLSLFRHQTCERHHNADLDHAVPQTQELYSVCNTPKPLTLKVRCVPFLCPPCIEDNGKECLNSTHTDPWRLVKLIPEKDANLRKYQKRKRPYVSHNLAQQEESGETIQNAKFNS